MLVEITNRYFKTAANHMIVKVTNFFYSVWIKSYFLFVIVCLRSVFTLRAKCTLLTRWNSHTLCYCVLNQAVASLKQNNFLNRSCIKKTLDTFGYIPFF